MTDLVFVKDEKVARRCAARPVPILVAPIVLHVPMIPAPVPVVVPDSEREIAALSVALDMADIPLDGVSNMADVVTKIASIFNRSSP